MPYSQLATRPSRYVFLRLLFTSLSLFFVSAFCYGQTSESYSYPSSFVLGISLHGVPSSSSDVRRYSLNTINDGFYYDISNKHKSSPMFRVKGEFQFTYAYVRSEIGIRTERTNLEAHNFQEVYNFAPGQSDNAEVFRDLYINEKTTSLLISIEAGSYFLRRDRPFRLGIGGGFDFCAYLPSKETGLNVLYKEERIINPSFPDIYETYTTSHTEGSAEWKTTVRDVAMPLVVPKLSLKASYRIYPNLSLSAEARMRFLLLKPYAKSYTMLLEFPVGIGLHYHFLN